MTDRFVVNTTARHSLAYLMEREQLTSITDVPAGESANCGKKSLTYLVDTSIIAGWP